MYPAPISSQWESIVDAGIISLTIWHGTGRLHSLKMDTGWITIEVSQDGLKFRSGIVNSVLEARISIA